MHLLAFPDGASYGVKGSFGLEQPDDVDLSNPWGGSKFMFAHWFADANLTLKSTTAGADMLAGGCICPVSQRQHLKAPCAHTVEVVGAGTNFSIMIPIIGVLQELHINLGKPTPLYLDSLTTLYVATSDTAIKKSVWLIRRAAVLEDGVEHGMIKPIHMSSRRRTWWPIHCRSICSMQCGFVICITYSTNWDQLRHIQTRGGQGN